MRKRLAKILATLGPASAAPDMISLLHEVGVDAFRLNFSHGSHADHARSVKAIRAVQEKIGHPITIVADMQGPKLRVGTFPNGGIDLRYGETLTLEIGDAPVESGDPEGLIRLPHPELLAALEPGHVLKFDDGKLMATVTDNDGTRILAKVDVPGRLGDKKGINVIDAILPLSAMTEKDRRDMDFALSQNVDYIALSFVQTAQDVRDARDIIGDKAGIIVKIEKPSAVEALEDILTLADAAMVARGDLGVELPLERVPVVQRQIIRMGRMMGKPVIVATHMLESMIESPTPTRAEASDVATAIYQGADAVMLSAETAVGRHPTTAVAIMDRIIGAAESDPEFWNYFKSMTPPRQATSEDAISQSVRAITDTLGSRAVFGFTASGSTVQRIARERPACRIIGLTPNPRTANRLALTWGVLPIVTQDPASFDDMIQIIQALAKDAIKLDTGDPIMISAGIPFGKTGTTNTLKISLVE